MEQEVVIRYSAVGLVSKHPDGSTVASLTREKEEFRLSSGIRDEHSSSQLEAISEPVQRGKMLYATVILEILKKCEIPLNLQSSRVSAEDHRAEPLSFSFFLPPQLQIVWTRRAEMKITAEQVSVGRWPDNLAPAAWLHQRSTQT